MKDCSIVLIAAEIKLKHLLEDGKIEYEHFY
jgi:hypothetical protein